MMTWLGYYIYRVPLVSLTKLMNACLNYGIEIGRTEENETDVTFRISVHRAQFADEVFRKEGIAYTKSALAGLFGKMKKIAHCPGLIVGIVLSLFLYIWLSGMVWEVRVVSSGDIDEDRVLQILRECGLEEGSRVADLDVDELVAEYLLKDRNTAFAAIHINGLVAEIELVPREDKEEPDLPGGPCNIIATEDALITDITVYAGKPLVKVGQTVRRGDILVSGIISDVGGTRFVRASADILGQRVKDITIDVADNIKQTHVVSSETDGVDIRFFSHWFSFGEKGNEAISEGKQLYLFGMFRLPIYVTKHYSVFTEEQSRQLTKAEQQNIAEERLSQQILNIVGDGTLLSIDKKHTEVKNCYKLSAHIVFEGNIGKALAFDVENN